jgi:hypothetical protein
MIEALKPATAAADLVTVVYKGPFPELKLDGGETIYRGRRAELPREVVARLQSTPAGEAFVVIETATSPVSCTG